VPDSDRGGVYQVMVGCAVIPRLLLQLQLSAEVASTSGFPGDHHRAAHYIWTTLVNLAQRESFLKDLVSPTLHRDAAFISLFTSRPAFISSSDSCHHRCWCAGEHTGSGRGSLQRIAERRTPVGGGTVRGQRHVPRRAERQATSYPIGSRPLLTYHSRSATALLSPSQVRPVLLPASLHPPLTLAPLWLAICLLWTGGEARPLLSFYVSSEPPRAQEPGYVGPHQLREEIPVST